MAKLVCFIFFAALCYVVVAVSKTDVYKIIHRIGQEKRQQHITELQQAINNTRSRAMERNQMTCINTQISSGYRDLNAPLGHALNTLKNKYKAMPAEEVDALDVLQIEEEVRLSTDAALSSFGDRIQEIQACV